VGSDSKCLLSITITWVFKPGVCVKTGVKLDRWSAYLTDMAEGHYREELIEDEEALDVSFLPPLKRRRLSRLSRLSLRLAHAVAPDFKGYCVFGSQHGELVTTQALLESIVEGEIVSPAGFSASVHNTAVGLHSINCKNTYPCTSVAAGLDTLAMCLVESSALLTSGEAREVLLVYADDSVPQGLAEFVDINDMRGFAALIKPADSVGGITMTLGLEEADPSMEKTEAVRSLVGFLMKTGGPVVMPGETGQWRWQD
jgi:hypothetical protein